MILRPSKLRISGGGQQILGGVLVVPAVQEMLAGYLERATTVVLSSGLASYELQRIGTYPILAERALSLNNDCLTFNHPPRPEEMVSLIRDEFAVSPSASLRMLAELINYLPRNDLISLLRDNIVAIAALFTAEKVDAREFGDLLDLLGKLGNHDLNRAFLEEFMDNDTHDPFWTEGLLSLFREKFPDEPCYHEIAGDFNCRLKLYGPALEAYARARALSPDKKALDKKIGDAEQALKRESLARAGELKRSVEQLWEKCAEGNQAATVALRQLAGVQVDEFFQLLGSGALFLRDEAANLKVFEALESSAEAEKLKGLAKRFHGLSDELVTDTLQRMAAGKAVNESRAKLIKQLLADKAIEQLPPGMLEKLAAAGEDPTNKNYKLCAEVYVGLFAEAHYLASDDYFAAGRLDEAMAELRLCLQVNPLDRHARHNIASILAQQAEKALESDDRTDAGGKLDEALRLNPECLPALDLQMKMALTDHNYDRAIASVKRMLVIIEANLNGENAGFWKKLFRSNLNNLGVVYFQRYLHSREAADLTRARAHFEKALESGPRHEDHVYNLIRVRFWQGQMEAVVEWGREYFSQEQVDFRKAIDLSEQIWDYLGRQGDRTAVEPLLRQISAYLRKFMAGRAEPLVDVPEYALQLTANGFPDLAEQLTGLPPLS